MAVLPSMWIKHISHSIPIFFVRKSFSNQKLAQNCCICSFVFVPYFGSCYFFVVVECLFFFHSPSSLFSLSHKWSPTHSKWICLMRVCACLWCYDFITTTKIYKANLYSHITHPLRIYLWIFCVYFIWYAFCIFPPPPSSTIPDRRIFLFSTIPFP